MLRLNIKLEIGEEIEIIKDGNSEKQFTVERELQAFEVDCSELDSNKWGSYAMCKSNLQLEFKKLIDRLLERAELMEDICEELSDTVNENIDGHLSDILDRDDVYEIAEEATKDVIDNQLNINAEIC